MLPLVNILTKRPKNRVDIGKHSTPENLNLLLTDALDIIKPTDKMESSVREYIDRSHIVKDRGLALKRAKRRLFDINFINNGRVTGRLPSCRILEPDHIGNKPDSKYLATGAANYADRDEILNPHFGNLLNDSLNSTNPLVPDYSLKSSEDILYDLVTSCCFSKMKVNHQGNIVTASPLVPPGGDNVHQPVIDLDIPAKLLPSFQDGHSHLYLDVKMNWTDYLKLLKVMSEVGIIEKEYYEVSKKKGYTAVRAPCDSVVYPFEEEYESASVFTAGLSKQFNTKIKPISNKSDIDYLQEQIDFLESENEKLRERLDELTNVARR
jgi:hypothetical protein